MEDGKTQSVSPQVEGVPQGWRLVRIGRPRTGEFVVAANGSVVQANASLCGSGFAIVERIPEPKPVCTWPGRPGVLTLSKGWVARNPSGILCFFNKRPTPNLFNRIWSEGGNPRKLSSHSFTDLPVFNPDLPWTEHIVEVGGEETVVVKDEWYGTTMEVAGKVCEPMDCDQTKLVNPDVPRIAEHEHIKDGWVAQDLNGGLWWYESQPRTANAKATMWIENTVGSKHAQLNDSEVVFPSSWPWDQRIVRIKDGQIVRGE